VQSKMPIRLVPNEIVSLESVSPGSGIVQVYDANGEFKEMRGFADPRIPKDLITLACLKAVFGNGIDDAMATRDVRFQMEDWGYVLHKRSFQVVESICNGEESIDIVLGSHACEEIQIMYASRDMSNSRRWSTKLSAEACRVQTLEPLNAPWYRLQTLRPSFSKIKSFLSRGVDNSSQSVANQSPLLGVPIEIWRIIIYEVRRSISAMNLRYLTC
jgi:hypothetical protein